MLTDGAERVRCEAVDSILDLRAQNNKGDTGVRTFRIPKINQDATHVTELIKMDEENVTEPILTAHLTKMELIQFRKVPMTVAAFPSHTQSVERCIKLVTMASVSVCGHDARDGFIRAGQHPANYYPSGKAKRIGLYRFRSAGSVGGSLAQGRSQSFSMGGPWGKMALFREIGF